MSLLISGLPVGARQHELIRPHSPSRGSHPCASSILVWNDQCGRRSFSWADCDAGPTAPLRAAHVRTPGGSFLASRPGSILASGEGRRARMPQARASSPRRAAPGDSTPHPRSSPQLGFSRAIVITGSRSSSGLCGVPGLRCSLPSYFRTFDFPYSTGGLLLTFR